METDPLPRFGGLGRAETGSDEAKGLPAVQLYDLKQDPAERRNIQAEHPEVVQPTGTAAEALCGRREEHAG